MSGFDIRESIENATIEERLEQIDILYNKWVLTPQTTVNLDIFAYLKLAIENFDLSLNNLQAGLFEQSKLRYFAKLMYLRMFFDMKDQEKLDSDVVEQTKIHFNKIYRAIVDADKAICSAFNLQNSMSETEIGLGTELDISRYQPYDPSTNTAWQNVLLFLKEKLFNNNYRRYDGQCYEKVRTPVSLDKSGRPKSGGYDTHSWKLSMTLETFIYTVIKKETHYEMWKNLTNGQSNVSASVKYLEKYIGPEFEDIKKDRHVFAFNNGIYIARGSRNVIKEPTSDSDNDSDLSDMTNSKISLISKTNECEEIFDEWIPYTGPMSKKIGSNVVASKYFNMNFDINTRPQLDNPEHRYNDPFNIIIDKCPNFRSIMLYQNWPDDVQKWMCILIGRMLYQINELDGWQIAPYLLGQAGTGKSTIVNNIIKKFYEDTDTGTISNNIEKLFGLSGLYQKFLCIAPEIKANFNLEQAEFQSLISGEAMSLAKKHETAKTGIWNVPVIFAGNEVPNYSDNSGSISRRLLVFNFNKKVKKADTKLMQKLEKEIGHIIHACNRIYLNAVSEFGSEEVWNVCPQYFRDTRDEMAESTNPLVAFIKSDRVILGPSLYVPDKEFEDAFHEYCKDKNIVKVRLTTPYRMGPFGTYDLEYKKAEVVDTRGLLYPQQSFDRRRGNFVFGLDIVYRSQQTQQQTDIKIEEFGNL